MTPPGPEKGPGQREPPPRWANGGTLSPAASLARFQEGLPVHLIATPRGDFATCRPEESVSAVVDRNRDAYDFFPVVEHGASERGQVVGLFEVAPFMGDGRSVDQTVRSHMAALSESNLIGADASILAFIQDADRFPCRLVVSGSEISGLVTLSDLQQLPVRAALFAMVTQLEMTMAEAIRRESEDDSTWLSRLSGKRRSMVDNLIRESQENGAFVDSLLFTQFCDKVTIIKRSDRFSWSRNRFERELNRIQDLRDDLAHANDYAASPDAAKGVCGMVRQMVRWIDHLTNWPGQPAALDQKGHLRSAKLTGL